MNIPLNIDWQQIFLHLLNFSILTLGLYLLLYNPVKKFMDERSENYEKQDIKTKEKLKQAEELELSYKQRLENIETELNEKRALAVQDAQQEADGIIDNAKKQAENLIADAQESALKEREKILEDAQKEIASMAVEATEKLLTKSAMGTLDQFLAAAKKE